jgi:peroxiredoxin
LTSFQDRTGMKPRTLALVAALVGAVVAASLLAAPRSPQSPAAQRAETGTPSAATAASHALTIDQAIKELDLVRLARPAHDFTLKTLEGKPFRLADQRGKVVLLNFWATWCPPCREEMPAMQRLYLKQKDNGFVMVAVALDGDPELVPPFVKERHLEFVIALDPKMDTANAYGVRALPSSFIIDKKGTMAALALGPRAWDNRAAQALVEGLVR